MRKCLLHTRRASYSSDLYIKPDAETGQPLRVAFTAACDKVLPTLVA